MRRRWLGVGCGLGVLACGSKAPLGIPEPGAIVDAGVDDGGLTDGGVNDRGLEDGGATDAGLDVSFPYGHGCSAQQDATGLVRRTGMIGTDGLVHLYYSYVPVSYDAGWAIPLVVSLHGAGNTALEFVGLWQSSADANDFMVLAPQGSGSTGDGFAWNDLTDESVVLGAMDDISRCYRTDMHRHIVHGFSAGGIMAYLIGLPQSGVLFSGLAIASSGLETAEYYANEAMLPPLLPSAWEIPVSIFHGLQDPNFDFTEFGEGSRDALLDAGHTVYFHPFDGGHVTDSADCLQMWTDLNWSRSP